MAWQAPLESAGAAPHVSASPQPAPQPLALLVQGTADSQSQEVDLTNPDKALATALQPPAAANKAVDDMVLQMQAQFGKNRAAATKRPAAALTGAVLKRHAALVVDHLAGAVLGCWQCRFRANGCARCLNPRFKGKRGEP